MPPISSQELIDLVRPIVESELPHELLAFDLSAVELMDERSKKRRLTVPGNPESFGFLGAKETSDVLEYVRLLSGTLTFLAAVLAVVKQRQPEPLNLKREWTARLEEAGLSRVKASRIADKFLRQVISQIQGRRG